MVSCEENLDIHVPLLERGHMLLKLRSKDLRTGRAPKDLKISLSKLLPPKFNSVSLLIFDKQLDSEKKNKNKNKISRIKYVSKIDIYVFG